MMIIISALNTVLNTVTSRDRGISNLSPARYVLSFLVVIIQRLRREKGNVDGWKPSDSDKNTGVGGHGSCCPGLDTWETDKISTALTTHPCTSLEQAMCNRDNCSGTYSDNCYGSNCDPDGCEFNPFRLVNESFFGPNKIVDGILSNSVISDFCIAQKKPFGDENPFSKSGGLSRMDYTTSKKIVLVLSLWDDHYANAL